LIRTNGWLPPQRFVLAGNFSRPEAAIWPAVALNPLHPHRKQHRRQLRGQCGAIRHAEQDKLGGADFGTRHARIDRSEDRWRRV